MTTTQIDPRTTGRNGRPGKSYTAATIEREGLAEGIYAATADLRELSLHDVIEAYAACGDDLTTMYRDGYATVLYQAELVAWDLWQSTRTTQPTHVRKA